MGSSEKDTAVDPKREPYVKPRLVPQPDWDVLTGTDPLS